MYFFEIYLSACFHVSNPLLNESPPPLRGVIRRSKAWDSIDKAMLSLSLWQELRLWMAKPVCWTERREEAAAKACWHINKLLKRCPELTDQDRSNNGSSSVRDFSFQFTSVLFPFWLILPPLIQLFSILSVSGLPSLSISSMVSEQRWKRSEVLASITQDNEGH